MARAVSCDASLWQSKYLIQASRFSSANLELAKLNRKFATNRRLKMRFDFLDTPTPPPEFHPAHSLVGFETLEKAESDRRELVSLLRVGTPAQQKLAEIISPCQPGARCGSAACRVYGRRFRIHFAGHLAELIATDDDDWFAVSLVPGDCDCMYPLGRLRDFNPDHFKDRVRKQLERSVLADAAVVLGIDFAVQIFSQPNQAPLWRPHGYMLIRGYSTEVIRAALDRYYPRGPRTPRPIYSRKIDKTTALRVTSYAYKCQFNIRSQIGGVDGNHDTHKRPLESIHLLEIAPLLHQWGFGGRYLLRGFCRASDPNGKITLQIKNPFSEFVRAASPETEEA
jgi:hypothetical protein